MENILLESHKYIILLYHKYAFEQHQFRQSIKLIFGFRVGGQWPVGQATVPANKQHRRPDKPDRWMRYRLSTLPYFLALVGRISASASAN